MTGLDDLSREDLLKIMARDRGVKAQLQQRIGALVGENAELLGFITELQEANQTLTQNNLVLTQQIAVQEEPAVDPEIA